MRRKKLLIVFIIFFNIFYCFSSDSEDINFSIGYFGELITHPGVTFAIDKSIWLDKKFSLLLKGNIGGYSHPGYSIDFFILPELSLSYNIVKDLHIDFNSGLGWLVQLPGGPVYIYENGSFHEELKLQNFIMPSLGLRFSFNRLFFGLKAFWQYPFNDQWLIHPALELGYKIPLNVGEK